MSHDPLPPHRGGLQRRGVRAVGHWAAAPQSGRPPAAANPCGAGFQPAAPQFLRPNQARMNDFMRRKCRTCSAVAAIAAAGLWAGKASKGGRGGPPPNQKSKIETRKYVPGFLRPNRTKMNAFMAHEVPTYPAVTAIVAAGLRAGKALKRQRGASPNQKSKIETRKYMPGFLRPNQGKMKLSTCTHTLISSHHYVFSCS